MKPRNFPERANQRRKEALDRLGKPRVDGEPRADSRAEETALAKKIAPSLRQVRTKKPRLDRAGLGRK